MTIPVASSVHDVLPEGPGCSCEIRQRRTAATHEMPMQSKGEPKRQLQPTGRVTTASCEQQRRRSHTLLNHSEVDVVQILALYPSSELKTFLFSL
ncbi:unnamed protein product [Lampetra fluviatilis]